MTGVDISFIGSRITCYDRTDFARVAKVVLKEGYQISARINNGKYMIKILGAKEDNNA